MDMRRAHSGLSLIEVIIAFTVLTIAGLGVIAAMTRLMMAQSSSSHQTVARIMGDSVMQEEVLAGPPDGIPLGTAGSVVKTRVRVGQNSEPVEYSHTVTWELMDPVPGMGEMGLVYQVKIKVWWNLGDEAEGAIEKGTRTLEISRLTYVEE
jgi:Prokaryotic N-terminal methylation motif